jgi:prepilin-type N-terminal cleavage/methylation domain-containing protein
MRKSDEATERRSNEGKCELHFSPSVASSLRRSVASPGFTLIEVLITMLLLSILVPVLMEGLSLSLHAASNSRHKTEAANIAQDELNMLVSTGEWNTNPQGTVGDYNWKCQSADQDYGLSQVQLTVSWLERGQTREFTVSTFAQTNPTLPGSDTTTTQ